MNVTTERPERGIPYLYMVAAFVVVAFGMRASQEILQPLLLSFFIAVVCVPIYAGLVERRVSPWLSLLIVICGLMAVTLVVFWIVMTSLADFTSRQDHYADQLRLRTKPLRDIVERLIPEQPGVNPPQANLIENDDRVGSLSDIATLASAQFNQSPERGNRGADNETTIKRLMETSQAEPESVGDSNVESANGFNEVRPLINEISDSLPGKATGNQEAPGAHNSSEKANGDEAYVEELDKESESVETAATDPELTSNMPSQDPAYEGRLSDNQDVGFAPGNIFEPRRIVVAPRSRRSWRQLVLAQFDPGMALSLAATLASTVSQVLSNSLLILLTVVFILLEASSFPRKLTAAFGAEHNPSPEYQRIVDSIRSYIVLKTGVSLLTGVLIAGWLSIFGVPYVGLWGMLAFLLNYIPNVGSIIAAIPALIVAWLDLGLTPCIGCAVGYVAVNIAIGNLLEPKLMGRGLGLSPLVIFCSMLFWGWTLGPVGMLLSVPLTMGVRVGLEGFDDTRWLGILLSNAET